MSAAKKPLLESHVVDILGSTRGRDQPIMLMEKAYQLVCTIPDSTYLDDESVFLDPFCKAGEILLAAAIRLCALHTKQLPQKVSESDIANEIFGGRFFALGPDERHFLLSKRTFMGNERSHKIEGIRTIINGNYLSETDGKLDELKFEREFINMINYIRKTKPKSKIIAVGNPPYQEGDGGGDGYSASPVYNYFVEKLMSSGHIDELAVVIPARWFSGGRNLDDFRERLVKSKQVKSIQYFERAEDVFPTVHVQGGICFVNWSKSYKGQTTFTANSKSQNIDLDAFDIIPDDPDCHSIIDKISTSIKTKNVGDIAWTGKPFGIRTYFFKRNEEASPKNPNAIKCYSQGRKVKHLLRSAVTANEDKIDKYKVAVPATYATGARRCTLPKHGFFLVGKGEIVTETYNIVGCFETKREAESFIEYLQTDLARYLLGLRKLTGRVTKDRWNWVPLLDLTKSWTDESLFAHFKMTKQEQAHIRKKVQEWS